jgi:hypothetical protein
MAGGGNGEGAKSYDGEKVCCSKNHSILYVVPYLSNLFVLFKNIFLRSFQSNFSIDRWFSGFILQSLYNVQFTCMLQFFSHKDLIILCAIVIYRINPTKNPPATHHHTVKKGKAFLHSCGIWPYIRQKILSAVRGIFLLPPTAFFCMR